MKLVVNLWRMGHWLCNPHLKSQKQWLRKGLSCVFVGAWHTFLTVIKVPQQTQTSILFSHAERFQRAHDSLCRTAFFPHQLQSSM